MLFALGTTAAFVLLASYLLFPRRLHPLEQLLGAFLSIFLYAIHYLIYSVNRQWYEVNAMAETTFVFILVRFVMTPTLVLWLLELMIRLRSLFGRIVLIAAFAACCTAGAVLMRSSGILIYREWHPGSIYSCWLLHAMLTIAGVRLYRTVLRKEVRLL